MIVLENRVVEFAGEEFASYRLADEKIAPDAEPGYIFAGWFLDVECKKALETDTANTVVYAKFVYEDVLNVKAQVTAGTTADSEKTNIRFVTTVDSLDYKKVGFCIEIDGLRKDIVSNTTVYEALYAVENGTVDTLNPAEFSPVSQFFSTYAYWNVPSAYFDTEFTVVPYWITLDGTVVYGETAVKTISRGI